MVNSTERKTTEAEREATRKTQARAQQAAIVAGLQTVLESDEQLLAFTRGHISGGWRGKLAVGPEAFFAPDVNVGLTERRIILQHYHSESGRPSEILPHLFPLSEIATLHFTDIETFGKEPAGRLVIRFPDDQHFRIRLTGVATCEDAKSMVEVFMSLSTARRKAAPRPTQSLCANCGKILDRPSKFCPYCGAKREDSVEHATAESPVSEMPTAPEPPVAPTPPPPPEFGIPTPPSDFPQAPDFGIAPVAPVTPDPFVAQTHETPPVAEETQHEDAGEAHHSEHQEAHHQEHLVAEHVQEHSHEEAHPSEHEQHNPENPPEHHETPAHEAHHPEGEWQGEHHHHEGEQH